MNPIILKVKELSNLYDQVKIINETLTPFENENKNSENIIERGCRVLLKNNDGTSIEGRVWRIKYNGEVEVNRDGYESYMNCKLQDLTNLSIGTIGNLEKQRWIKQQRMKSLSMDIDHTSLDFIEFDLDLNKLQESLRIEVLDIKEIRNTNAKFITLRKENNNTLFKIISSHAIIAKLTLGTYTFNFYRSVLISIT
ncbi:hypothetical protein [Flavobacterium sp. IMCC34518]|uniref:hypothetical protein n=1 Tax=Flavobacterium sp. IMCC34518 TaxID=3003623 RepID=UPI0022AC4849|nr:hypothetical protein [Flavobacterium sp. IMCC34518]